MSGELSQVVAGGTARLAQPLGELGRGGRTAEAQRVQQLHTQGVREPTQGAGIEGADLWVLWVLGLVHAYNVRLTKEWLQRFLCNHSFVR
ncbi:hypothetical protein GCM10010350_45760 [Streptomyces galilaeus]|nr:hypothetical protein GCM10010350_45760 [Streptomyces galilaeus]